MYTSDMGLRNVPQIILENSNTQREDPDLLIEREKVAFLSLSML